MRAKEYITKSLELTLKELGFEWSSKITIEPPKDKKFGDVAVNCALVLAKESGMNPRELAEKIAEKLRKDSNVISSVEVAGPGFLNISLQPSFWQEIIKEIEKEPKKYGSSCYGNNKKTQVEFVSANPTGPLHIGHGRGAAIGDSIQRILKFTGFDVEAEYYLNDAGSQMNKLGLSIYKRILEINGKTNEFEEDLYQGKYIIDIANDILKEIPNILSLSETEALNICLKKGLDNILFGIKKDLEDFGVNFSNWFSESSLIQSGEVDATFNKLKLSGHTYNKDGALWFRSTELGDDKDRVLTKSDNTNTYFASDIAYHANKYNRGFKTVIDVWGADHHGYIPRMKAAVAALGQPDDAFNVVLVQLVNLIEDGAHVAMTTRGGKFETLADVVQDVGVDATRFIFLSRKSDSKLDFDLSLVKQRTMDNPVYYVQYAHARIQTVLRRAIERGISLDLSSDLSLITERDELDILKALSSFPQVVIDASKYYSPHFICFYLLELAGLLHKYYANHHILVDDLALSQARLRLIIAVGYVIRNGLDLLGVSAPDSM